MTCFLRDDNSHTQKQWRIQDLTQIEAEQYRHPDNALQMIASPLEAVSSHKLKKIDRLTELAVSFSWVGWLVPACYYC